MLLVEYSNALNIAWNIKPLTFFSNKNPALNLKTKKVLLHNEKNTSLSTEILVSRCKKNLFLRLQTTWEGGDSYLEVETILKNMHIYPLVSLKKVFLL